MIRKVKKGHVDRSGEALRLTRRPQNQQKMGREKARDSQEGSFELDHKNAFLRLRVLPIAMN